VLGHAPALPEAVADAGEQRGVPVHEELGAVDAAGLLVGQAAEHDVAGRRGAALEAAQQRADHHRDAPLHVEGAPAPDPAVHQLAGEGRPGPALAGRGHHVHVALHQERRRLPAAGDPDHQVRPVGGARQQVGLGLGREEAADEAQAGALVSRWVGGIEADQLLEELRRRHGVLSL
jgi:hypothetical protein